MLLPYKDLYMKHERVFRRTFGVSMRPYMDFLLGFDIVKFDDWLGTPDGTSAADWLKQKYGDEACALVEALLV